MVPEVLLREGLLGERLSLGELAQLRRVCHQWRRLHDDARGLAWRQSWARGGAEELRLALEHAVTQGNVATARTLLEGAEAAGVRAELLLLPSVDGESCLLVAAFEGSAEMVKTLLGGAEAAGVLAELLLLRTRDGESCLAVSAHKRNAEALRELLEAARAAQVLGALLGTTSEHALLELADSRYPSSRPVQHWRAQDVHFI